MSEHDEAKDSEKITTQWPVTPEEQVATYRENLARYAAEVSGAFSSVKDSGRRQEFDTGSRRDTRDGKGRYDLIPPYFLKRLAVHLENGAKKYGDKNWQKGQPLSRYLDSAMRHLCAVLDNQDDEDHAAAVAWNVMAFMCTKHWIETAVLPSELDDGDFTA